jgi:hypothetical protein
MDDEAWRRLLWTCFGDLSADPLGGRISGHRGPDKQSVLEMYDEQPLEKFESGLLAGQYVKGFRPDLGAESHPHNTLSHSKQRIAWWHVHQIRVCAYTSVIALYWARHDVGH